MAKRVADHYEQVEVRSTEELRAWLHANHHREQGVWLVHYKKHRPEYYISHGDIAGTCLCFGWIDGLVRRLDEDRTMHLIGPRKAGSIWSRVNKEKVARLQREGLMTPPGQAVIDRAQKDGSWTLYDDVENLVVPDDLAEALADGGRDGWDAFAASSRKAILWWIKSAKTEPTRSKRIAHTTALAEVGLRANYPEDEKKWKAGPGRRPERRRARKK